MSAKNCSIAIKRKKFNQLLQQLQKYLWKEFERSKKWMQQS